MKLIFKKTILLALAAAIMAAALPFASVSAKGQNDLSMLAAEISKERLEDIWARQLRAYDRLGKGFDRADDFTAKAQNLIDRVSENGKDVTALQAALDAFEASIKKAHPIYESASGIVNSHQGFDAKGQVTDPEKAKDTVRSMGEKLKEIRSAMDGTGRALREAIQAFREANPRPQPTITPES